MTSEKIAKVTRASLIALIVIFSFGAAGEICGSFFETTAAAFGSGFPDNKPEDVKSVGPDVLRHRVILSYEAEAEDIKPEEIIQRIFAARDSLRGRVNVVYLQNYDLELGKLLTSGVDVWLNTPQPPMEASGTSGMKAALNGVPSLSVLDGWWIEGCIEGVTGWAIGSAGAESDATDAESLYDKLAKTVIPIFYEDPSRFVEVMCHAIALNGAFFNTQRMIQQYIVKAYF